MVLATRAGPRCRRGLEPSRRCYWLGLTVRLSWRSAPTRRCISSLSSWPKASAQFLSFEETIAGGEQTPREVGAREEYFAGLEALRAHIYRSMIQVAAIADVTIPKIADSMRYDGNWDLDNYAIDVPELPIERQSPHKDCS